MAGQLALIEGMGSPKKVSRKRRAVIEDWQRRNPEKIAEYRRRARAKGNSESKRRSNREWKRRHPDKVADQKWRRNIRRLYGLTAQEYDRLAKEQGHRCKVCSRGVRGKRRLLAVDHEHVSGAVRGLLCDQCNVAIGMMGEDPGRLELAAAYLRQWRAGPTP